jgi:hypothetical protein
MMMLSVEKPWLLRVRLVVSRSIVAVSCAGDGTMMGLPGFSVVDACTPMGGGRGQGRGSERDAVTTPSSDISKLSNLRDTHVYNLQKTQTHI